MDDAPVCEICYAEIDRDEITESLGRLGYLACRPCAENDNEEN